LPPDTKYVGVARSGPYLMDPTVTSKIIVYAVIVRFTLLSWTSKVVSDADSSFGTRPPKIRICEPLICMDPGEMIASLSGSEM
jgi:hypothetical protein